METKFQGEVKYRKWFFVPNYQYRILIETSETHWRRVGQPASSKEVGDETVGTVLEFFEMQDEMGILEVTVADKIAAKLLDNPLGKLVNRVRTKEPYENVGLLAHSNKLI